MNPLSGRLLPLVASALLAPFAFAQAPLTIGNLVVVRIGDATASNTAAATPTFLDEYTPTGAFVQTIALPTTPSGLNFACTNNGTATSEGQLELSPNGLYLTMMGYDAAVGTVGPAPAFGAVQLNPVSSVKRVVARIDLNGVVDTSTALTDAYDLGNPRGAVTDDGLRFWTTGSTSSGASAGIRLSTLGSSTSTQLNIGAPFNNRHIAIFHGDLYITAASGTVQGVARFGTGLPTSPATSAILPGFPIVMGPSNYDMFWASPTTVYVADDQTGGAGGIQKWVRNPTSGNWGKVYTLALNGSTGCTGVTGIVQGGVATLWATARSGTNTQIVTVVDNGLGSLVTSIVGTPPAGAFRGIRRIAKPSNTQTFAVGCGAAGLKVTGNADIGTDMFVSVTNSAVGLNIIGYGLTPAFLPFCNCTIAHEYLVTFGGPDHTLDISPSWGAALGLNIYVQAIDVFAPGGCADPFLTLSDAAQFTVQ